MSPFPSLRIHRSSSEMPYLEPGLTMFFSRYVAMHTMQEADSQAAVQDESQSNGYLDGDIRPSRRPKEGRSARLVLAAVGGMLLPLVTQIGHAH